MSGTIISTSNISLPNKPRGASSKAFPAQWLSPGDFLKSNPEPAVEDFENYFGLPLLELLVFYVYGNSSLIRDFVYHLEEDEKLLKAKVKVAEALNWLEEVGIMLSQAGKTTFTYEVRKHGQPHYPKMDEDGEIMGISLNLPFCAEHFSLLRLVSYDPETQLYYRYTPASGLWIHLKDAEVKKEISLYFKSFADRLKDFEGDILTKRTNHFLDQFRKLVASFTYFGKKAAAHFIHARNAMVPIASGKDAQSFSPIFFSKNQVETDYDKSAYCPRFIEHFLKCAVSEEDINLLQLWAGSALLGENLFHKILLITGEGGSGKSTFANIIERIVGRQNCGELRVSKLDDRFEIGRLLDRTLLIGRDVSADFLNNDAAYKLKGLTGGDTYNGEIKHSNERVQIIGKFNVLVTANAKLTLQLQGDEDAWRRRIWLVEFRKLKAFKKNVDLVDALIRNEGPGILNWMLKGARQILHLAKTKGDVTLSPAQRDRIDDLLDASKSLVVFIRDKIISSPKETLATSEITEAYEQFCAEKKWRPMGEREAQHEILAQMKEIHGERRRTDIKRGGKNVRGYAHVTFRPD